MPFRTLRMPAALLATVVAAVLLQAALTASPLQPVRRVAPRPMTMALAANAVPCADLDPDTGGPTVVLSVDPERIMLCERADVRLRLRLRCADPPLLVALVVDRSGSMVGASLEDAKAALLLLVDRLLGPGRPSTRAALISHGSPPTVDRGFSADQALLREGIAALDVPSSEVPDDLPEAIDLTHRLLLATDAGPGALRAIVLLSDGGQSHAAPQVLQAADRAQADGLLIASLCIRNRLASCPLMDSLASRADLAFSADDRAGMLDGTARIATAVGDLVASDVTLRADLPDGVELVAGSQSPLPDGDGLWHWPWLASEGVTLTWQVAPQREGRFAFPTPEVVIGAASGVPAALPAQAGRLEVSGSCGRPSATPEAGPPPTASPAPVATQAPRRLWLPSLLTAACLRPDGSIDLMLLLDTSSSMAEVTGAGRSKLAGAADGIRALAGVLGPSDRLGLMSFDLGPRLIAPLAADPTGLLAALPGLQLASGTRIDLALREAGDLLAAVQDRPGSQKAVILLTDGRVDEGAAGDAITTAAGLRDRGVLIQAIGLGSDVDRQLLEAIAGGPDGVALTDDAEALGDLYLRAARLLPCR